MLLFRLFFYLVNAKRKINVQTKVQEEKFEIKTADKLNQVSLIN